MKMYEARHGWNAHVDEIEVTRVTDSRIYFVKNGKETWTVKDGQYSSYHKTLKAAWDEIERRLEKQISHHKVRLENARMELEKVQKSRKLNP